MRKIRAVIAKVGLDGHDRGAKVIALGLRDAGMEVVYTGLRTSPDQLAEIVLQEDADVLGLSILSGAVIPLVGKVLTALKARDVDDVVVLVGGTITPKAKLQLNEMGITGVFGPGSSIGDIVQFINDEVSSKRII